MFSVLLYGEEVWTLTEATTNKLKTAELWLYRRMLRISCIQKSSKMKYVELLVQMTKSKMESYVSLLFIAMSTSITALSYEGLMVNTVNENNNGFIYKIYFIFLIFQHNHITLRTTFSFFYLLKKKTIASTFQNKRSFQQ